MIVKVEVQLDVFEDGRYGPWVGDARIKGTNTIMAQTFQHPSKEDAYTHLEELVRRLAVD